MGLKILNNNVLVMPDYEHYETTGETGLKLDTSYEVQKHAPTSGIVISVPDQLNYSKNKLDRGVLAFNTTMDVLPGDRVIFGYNVFGNAISDGRFMNDLIFIKYDSLFCAIRNNRVIMLNGYVIVEAIEDNINGDDFQVPDYMATVNSYTKGKILHVGKGNKEYRYYPHIGPDSDEFKPGQDVLFNMQYSIPLQYQMHSILDTKKELYRMQQKDISAIIEEFA